MGVMRDSIIARVKAETTSFKKIDTVADVQSILNSNGSRSEVNLQNVPAAFLHLVGQSADEAMAGTGGYRQRLTYRWSWVIVTRARNNVGGGKAAEQVDDLLWELDAAMCGFKPDDAESVIEKSRSAGRLISWRKDLLFFGAFYEVPAKICL